MTNQVNMSNYSIEIKNLNKTYGDFKAVNNLSFNVEESSCYGLLGPNGAGKTTTMKILYGKVIPDKVKDQMIRVYGLNSLKDSLKIKSISGIVPQQDNLDTELNVIDNLYIYSKFYGIKSNDAKNKISELLDFMELKEKGNSYVRELSGGMVRRLSIARALLNNPKLLILDEPTTGLDPQVRHTIWKKLRELKEIGVTILLTTHYMDEAFQICDKILILDKGNKILEGNPKELLRENLESYVLEVYDQNLDEEMTKKLISLKVRFESFNNILFIHSNKFEILNEISSNIKLNNYYIRQSNLEDLFLKVTGRRLNELQ